MTNRVQVHLVDGTFELFRAYFGSPPATAPSGQEVGATRGFARSMLALVQSPDVTHVAVAFDHVIESFRNDLYAGYKSGEGIEAELKDQFPLVEEVTRALGITAWPLVEFEADDGLAAGAAKFADHPDVERVVIATPDKDLTQCVRDPKVVTWDRMRSKFFDEAAVREKFGVSPASIPDYLALVGDTADGIPGVPRWGAKSTGAVLSRYGHLEGIPPRLADWDIKVRGAAGLSENLESMREEAVLFRTLATLREDVPITESLEDLEWKGADKAALESFCAEIGDERFPGRISTWR